jgi:hypothetical protein
MADSHILFAHTFTRAGKVSDVVTGTLEVHDYGTAVEGMISVLGLELDDDFGMTAHQVASPADLLAIVEGLIGVLNRDRPETDRYVVTRVTRSKGEPMRLEVAED